MQSKIWNYLFLIKYHKDSSEGSYKETFLINDNCLDSTFYLPCRIKNNMYSKTIEDYVKQNKIFHLYIDNGEFQNKLYYLSDLINIDSTKSLGVFVTYFGQESILYAYGILYYKDDYYFLDDFYQNIDATGLGGFSYEKPFKINDDEFYLVGHEKGEGIDRIAVHYFSKNNYNKTYIIEQCFPTSDGDETRIEKFEYNYEYEDEQILIRKYIMDNYAAKEWKLVSSKNYNIEEIIKKI